MAMKSAIIFSALLLGCLAVPVPEYDDVSIFFSEARSQRIVGGTAAPLGAHPWMVALSLGGIWRTFFCGGSIITQRTVLTAAHCLADIFNPPAVRLTVGTNVWNQGGQEYWASSLVIHEQYDGQTIKNDVAMIYPSTPIVYNNFVRAIPLSFDFSDAGVEARVAGWGAIVAQGGSQTNLLQIDVSTISGNECSTRVRQAELDLNMLAPHIDPAIEICTFRSHGVGTCQGDSGSALVRTDRGQQIGIVSWGFPCALGAPDMFARVSGFQSWILHHTRA